jgi:fermentation-respiration switch protein FrsA (DUF1100 family)
MKQIFRRMSQSIIFILVSVWLLLSILLYFLQPKFVYFPTAELVLTPSYIQLDYEDVFIKTDANTTIHGWFIPHNNPRGTLLFFHGNGGNISHRLDSLAIFNSLGLSVLIIDYSGYGQSEGNPSEQGTYKDAEAAWQYLLTEKQLNSKDIIIFGRSLGGAVAIWLANQNEPRALIVESAFSSVADIGKHYYPYLPVSLLARIKYPSHNLITSIKCPVLFVHSPDDDIVPYKFGRKLFMAANEPKEFLDIQGGHNDGFFVSGKHYVNGLDEFISKNL